MIGDKTLRLVMPHCELKWEIPIKETLMKKASMIGMALVLVLFLVTSCGAPKEQLERMSSELTAAQAETQSLQGKLSMKESELAAAQTETQSLQGKLSTKESELAAAQAKIQSLETKIQSLERQREAANQKLKRGKAKVEILNGVLMPALSGELDEMTSIEAVSYLLEWVNDVYDSGDATLIAKFEAIIGSGSTSEETMVLFLSLLQDTPESLKDFFLHLLESIRSSLR